MIAITVRLPWSAAIRAGVKTTENRGRPITNRHIGQPVAIHAAAAWSKEGAIDRRIRNWWGIGAQQQVETTDFSRLFRNVLAVATIADCHKAAWPLNETLTCCQPWGDRHYGDRRGPAWHIVFANVMPLSEPVGPVRGSLSVPWNLPDDIAARVAAQLTKVMP